MTLRYGFVKALAAMSLVGIVLGLISCEFPKSAPLGNSLPETRLANIPANDTIAQYISLGVRPEVQLYWLGDDPDGYVIGYRYRWTDVYRGQRVEQPYRTILNLVSIGASPLLRVMMVRGTPRSLPEMYRFFSTLTNQDQNLINQINDSLATGRPFAVPYKTGIVPGDSVVGADSIMHRSPTTGQFIFDSPADSNMHIFEVASIDNSGEVDPTPAIVHFWTLRSPAPIVTVTAPVVNTDISSGLADTDQIAIRYATDRFRGIRIDFTAIDQSTDERVFQWAVDDTVDPAAWSPWQESTTAYVTASSFRPIVSGWHRFYVRAKNRWGVLSNIATYNHSSGQGSFKATVPEIDSPGYVPRTVIINAFPPGTGALGSPDSNQVKAFYSEVMDSVGLTDKFDIRSGPLTWLDQSASVIYLGRYSTVIFLVERKLPVIGAAPYQLNTGRQANLRRYLQAGGNLVFVGPIDSTVFSGTPFSNFAYVYFHRTGHRRNDALDCVGMAGVLGYPDIRIDPNKLPADSLGAVRFVLSSIPVTFGETIGQFVSRTNDLAWQGAPVAFRYLAPEPTPPARRTFSVVNFGIPLYFCQKSSVIQAMRKALTDVHQLP